MWNLGSFKTPFEIKWLKKFGSLTIHKDDPIFKSKIVLILDEK